MPEIINTEYINSLMDIVDREGVAGTTQVYQQLNDKGYFYGGWANGVATGDTTTGQAALLFMQQDDS